MDDVPALLAALGDQFAGVRTNDVTRYTARMVSQTFGVRSAETQLDLVVKVNIDARCFIFGANRLVCNHFALRRGATGPEWCRCSRTTHANVPHTRYL